MKEDLSEVLSNVHVHVFVMGPAPESDLAAGELRKHLIQRCKDFGYSALMEHGEILDAVRETAGSDTDLAYIEEVHAKRVNVLVFLPASPGSFAELGYFAGLARGEGGESGLGLIRKSIVLVDQEVVPETVERGVSRGFVIDGPVAQMNALGARIAYVSYADLDSAWQQVEAKIEAERRFESRG